MKALSLFLLTIVTTSALSQMPNDQGLIPRTPIENIFVALPAGYQASYRPDTYILGHHWNHYSMKTPMAWMMTKEQFFSAGCKRQSAHKNCISGNIRNVFSLL